MTPTYIRHLVIHTVCNVTGAEPDDIADLNNIELNTRDWEQVFSRIEATLDLHTGMLASPERSISVDALVLTLHAKLTNDIIT